MSGNIAGDARESFQNYSYKCRNRVQVKCCKHFRYRHANSSQRDSSLYKQVISDSQNVGLL